MFKNYLKTAWRNIWNNKLFSLINVIGLAIGLSASFVIAAIIYYDVTFDKFHENGDQIYRVVSDFYSPEGESYNRGVPVPLREAMQQGVPGVANTSFFYVTYIPEATVEEKVHKNPGEIIFTDEHYFKLFSYEWLAGQKEGALAEPNQVVITADRAKLYFPALSPQEILGKSIGYNDNMLATVVGVIANFEQRSDFIFEEFISYKTAFGTDSEYEVSNQDWGSTNSASQLFIQVEPKATIAEIQANLDRIAKEHESERNIALNQRRKFSLQPLSDLHFNQNYGAFDITMNEASLPVLKSLAWIALFLLLLACINFINLNTAQATKRAKEIGIRKTLGGSRKQLMWQFLGETFVLTLIAAIVSIGFSAWLFKLFASYLPKDVNFQLLTEPLVVGTVLIILIVVALGSGFYPAAVLARFNPMRVFRNQINQKNSHYAVRKYLTVFQFVVAQVFIIATLFVAKQINFMMSKDMGFTTEAVAYVGAPWGDNSTEKIERLRDEIKTLAHIQKSSVGGNPPASNSMSTTTTTYFAEDNEINTNLQLLYGDSQFMDVYGIELLAGRDRLNDTIKELVINETYLHVLGFENPKDVLQKTVKLGSNTVPIVGVMKDFNQRSLKSKVNPLAFYGGTRHLSRIHFTLSTANSSEWPTTISTIEEIYKSIYPDAEFRLTFMDDTIKTFYRQEQKMAVLLRWAMGLSIVISCLGLLGLVIHSTQKRTKEIGIRKVLGASLGHLNMIMCKEFLWMVGIAFLIAMPIAWWGLQNWLQDFAFKTSLSWWVFVLGGVLMILISLVIMSFKTLSVAKKNPVDSLRNE